MALAEDAAAMRTAKMRPPKRLGLTLNVWVLLGLVTCGAPSGTAAPPDELPGRRPPQTMARKVAGEAMTAAIQAELEHRTASAGRVTQPAEQRDLQRRYEDNGFKSLWIDAAGTPNFDAHDAVALLRRSTERHDSRR